MTKVLDLALSVKRTGHGQSFELDVEFQVASGITILFGPSGSGKSTILQAIAGLLRPDHGHIRLGDEVWFSEQEHVSPEKRSLGYLFQSLSLFPHMTALHNVCYGMPRSLSKPQRIEKAHEFLDRVAVPHLAKRRPHTFSGGEAQRVALARALARQPRLLLLDEPFSALDQDRRLNLAKLVVELVEELDIPTLQVTHDKAEAAAMGKRILRLDSGRIIEDGSAADVFTVA